MIRKYCSYVLILLFGVAGVVRADEVILSFNSDITVHPDATMTVVETIAVNAEGQQIRRGIYRDFPTTYKDVLGNTYRVAFDVLSVSRNGYSEPWFVENKSNGVRLYIGSAGRQIEPGNHVYEIRYGTNHQLGYFDGYDELYWNVTGNGWAFPILNATASVQLPDGVRASDMATEGYTGPAGSKGQDYRSRVLDDGHAWWEATRPLGQGEGLTLVVSWPKGYVYEPDSIDRATRLLRENRGLLIALTGFVLMLFYLFKVWSKYGRDPKPGPVFPHYEPPGDLSAGACRYVQQMGHDQQCVTAAVLSLAVKGHLTIHQGIEEAIRAAGGDVTMDDVLDKLSPGQRRWLAPLVDFAKDNLRLAYKNTYVLQKNSDAEDALPLGPGEKTLKSYLFESGDYLLLTSKNHRQMQKAIKAHKEALKRFYQRRNFLLNTGYVLPAAIIFFATLLLVLAFGEFSFAVGLLFFLGLAVQGIFAAIMKAPTRAGRKTMDHIAGFKLFLSVAEAQEIEGLPELATPLPESPVELYEKYMPYAVALDMERPWAKRFERDFAKIAAEQGQSYRPVWYRGRGPIHNFTSFSGKFADSFSSAISSSSAPPGSSSGSGGGGSSGGGGGGGGGGGW